MSTGTVPAAKISPRVVNGEICWYEGDTFTMHFDVSVMDQDGADVTIGDSDQLELEIINHRGEDVLTKTWTGSEREDAGYPLVVDAAVSGKFPRGTYLYSIILTRENRTTIVDRNRIRVERGELTWTIQ